MKIKYIQKIQDIKVNKKNLSETFFINFYKETKDKLETFETFKVLNINYGDKILEGRKFIRLIRSAIQKANADKIENIIFDFRQIKNINSTFNLSENKYDEKYLAKTFIENILLANYVFDKYKTKKSEFVKELYVTGDFNYLEKEGFKEGEVVSENVNMSRDLANTPGNMMTPSLLAAEAEKIFANTKVKVKILEESDVKKIGMNLFLAVGSGSVEDSKLIVCEYMNGDKNERPIVLVGKGITFDTGGLNLKLSGMEEMTMDMTGGATALMILKCASDIDLKKNIIVLVPAVENAISGSAYRPGDIIKSMEGITVEIGNTDAEGRLVMADTITYSKKYNPRLLIDVATLTGASLVALGEKASVLMTSDASLEKIIREAGEKTGEYVWPLPVWDEYEADIKSKFADILNTSNTGRYGGAITAGMFVREFASKLNDCRHAHLDIAPRMTSVKGDNLTQGATGEPVRMLLEVLKEL